MHAAYCYTQSMVVCLDRTLSWSVCLSVTMVSPAKTAEPIEVLYWGKKEGWTQVGPRKHVFDGGPDLHAKWQF